MENLHKALQDACRDADYDGYESLSEDRRAAIAHAVEQERSRIQLDETPTTAPLTELGRDLKNQTDMPTVLIDRMVRQGATKTLKKSKVAASPVSLRSRGCFLGPVAVVTRCGRVANLVEQLDFHSTPMPSSLFCWQYRGAGRNRDLTARVLKYR